jgi:hypothetical protein
VRDIKELNRSTGVKHLIPDFNGGPSRLAEVFESRPEVLAHNVETVASHLQTDPAPRAGRLPRETVSRQKSPRSSEKLPAATLD